MKIILISAIAQLGKIGDIVEVSNGYAKNFLIPSKRAICYTVANYKIFETKKQEFEQANLNNLDSASKVKEKIFGKDLIIIENASDDGRLYGSVSSSLIATKLNDMLGERLISRSDIFMAKPIKEIGVYQVRLNLHSDVSFEVRTIVTRSELEVGALLRGEKKGIDKSEQKSEIIDKSSSKEVEAIKSKRFEKKKEYPTED
ncbi:MAG: 50S ribosomal protein L9 [Proteobacteria bacterium]|nr:50S ribosomal protein L9 [Pseudomonadota bacterium]